MAMSDERKALVLVDKKSEAVRVDGKNPEELIGGLMVSMSQSEKEWRDVFSPGSKGLGDLALGIRLVNALGMVEREKFMNRFKQLASIHDKRNDNAFSFAVVSTLLVQAFDIEDGNRWNLPPMDGALRRWCVDVITDRLIDLRGRKDEMTVSDLLTIDGIVTRADESMTVGGYVETYITSENAGEIDDMFTEEQRSLISREMQKRTNEMAERPGRK